LTDSGCGCLLHRDDEAPAERAQRFRKRRQLGRMARLRATGNEGDELAAEVLRKFMVTFFAGLSSASAAWLFLQGFPARSLVIDKSPCHPTCATLRDSAPLGLLQGRNAPLSYLPPTQILTFPHRQDSGATTFPPHPLR
jgi:hypothetical protein